MPLQDGGSPKQAAAPAAKPTPTPTPPAATPPASMTPTQWASQVVTDLGFNPATDSNAVTDVLAWMQNEEPSSSWWGGFGTAADPTRINPLNMTGSALQNPYGYAPTPLTGNQLGGGLGTYPTLQAAASAEAEGIKDTKGFAPILQALQSGAGLPAFTQALEGTGYAQSAYGGAGFSPSQAASEAGGPTVTGGVGSPTGGTSQQLTPQQTQEINQYVDQYAKQNGLSPQQSSELNKLLTSAVENGQLQQMLGIQGATDQAGYAQQEYQNTTQQAQQQYGFEQQQFGIQGQQLTNQQQAIANQQAYLKGQQGYAAAQYGQTQQSFANQLANLIAGYGFQKQQLGQQEQSAALGHQQAQQGEAASGVFNTGTAKQEQEAYGITQAGFQTTAAQEAQQYQYDTKQLGIQEQQSALSYESAKSGYGYQQSQINNAVANLKTQWAQLGLSQQEAQAGLQNALTNAGLQNVMTTDQLQTQIGMMMAGMATPITSIISSLVSSGQMSPALVGG